MSESKDFVKKRVKNREVVVMRDRLGAPNCRMTCSEFIHGNFASNGIQRKPLFYNFNYDIPFSRAFLPFQTYFSYYSMDT
jgi:hypothetical protein